MGSFPQLNSNKGLLLLHHQHQTWLWRKNKKGFVKHHGSSRSLPQLSHPWQGGKEAFSATGAAQKDKGESKKLGAAQPSKSALAVKRAVTTLSVLVTDVQAAIQEIEGILTRLGAQSVSRESRDGNVYIAAQLQTERTIELLQQLSTVGNVQQKDISKESTEDNSLFRIEVTRNN